MDVKTSVELNEALSTLIFEQPESYSYINGSNAFADIQGTVLFYALWQGTLVVANVNGLPYTEGNCNERIFGFHIHEGPRCAGTSADPFADTKLHYNPEHCEHPNHAGDLPPLFGNQGYALMTVYTERFTPDEIVGRTVVIHDHPDDFATQPSGGSGAKIACGIILTNLFKVSMVPLGQ